MSEYTMTVTVDMTAEQAEEKVRAALAEQGFGILTEIDVEATLRAKIGEEIGTYKILGACNPPLAFDAISKDSDIGALLPCNVVIRGAEDGKIDVVAADPAAMLEMAGPALSSLAEDARARIRQALDSLT